MREAKLWFLIAAMWAASFAANAKVDFGGVPVTKDVHVAVSRLFVLSGQDDLDHPFELPLADMVTPLVLLGDRRMSAIWEPLATAAGPGLSTYRALALKRAEFLGNALDTFAIPKGT